MCISNNSLSRVRVVGILVICSIRSSSWVSWDSSSNNLNNLGLILLQLITSTKWSAKLMTPPNHLRQRDKSILKSSLMKLNNLELISSTRYYYSSSWANKFRCRCNRIKITRDLFSTISLICMIISSLTHFRRMEVHRARSLLIMCIIPRIRARFQ